MLRLLQGLSAFRETCEGFPRTCKHSASSSGAQSVAPYKNLEQASVTSAVFHVILIAGYGKIEDFSDEGDTRLTAR
jgi:hypothetical protein